MKYLPSILLIGLLVLTLRAQTPPPATPGDPFVKTPADVAAKAKTNRQNCFMVLEIYALEKNDALSVIEGDTGSAARYRHTTELARAGKARLETLTALTGRSAERSINEGIDEVRYPTEFAAPQDGKSFATPTAWETRNAGDTFEIEPVISDDGRTCDVALAPKRVILAGLRDTIGTGDDAPTSQPIFHTQNLVTTVTTSGDEWLYLGTCTPAPNAPDDGKASEVWLAFVRVVVQRPDEVAKAAPKSNRPEPLHFEYSIYSMDRAVAQELLSAASPVGAAWDKLQGLLGEKKARFEHLTTITSKSGQRVEAGETQEERYPTELQRSSRVGAVEYTQHTTVTGPSPDPAHPEKQDVSKSTTTTETTTVSKEDASSPRIPGYATVFETRNTGFDVEMEPMSSADGQSVAINQVVSDTVLLGNLKGVGVAAKYPWQPLFEHRKLTSSQTLPIGVHVLSGTLNPPGADGVNGRGDTGRTWVLFIRATPNEP